MFPWVELVKRIGKTADVNELKQMKVYLQQAYEGKKTPLFNDDYVYMSNRRFVELWDFIENRIQNRDVLKEVLKQTLEEFFS